MTSLKIIVPTLFLSLAALAPANALPASPAGVASQTASESPLVVLAQDRRDMHRRDMHRRDMYRHHRPAPRFVPGQRYRSAPHGWRRYHTRPRDWHTRGCVLVGPLWFCP